MGKLLKKVLTSEDMPLMRVSGNGEAVQYSFHGPGFVVVQPHEWSTPATQSGGRGGAVGNLFG